MKFKYLIFLCTLYFSTPNDKDLIVKSSPNYQNNIVINNNKAFDGSDQENEQPETIEINEPLVCQICLEENPEYKTNCNHLFHSEWYFQNNF